MTWLVSITGWIAAAGACFAASRRVGRLDDIIERQEETVDRLWTEGQEKDEVAAKLDALIAEKTRTADMLQSVVDKQTGWLDEKRASIRLLNAELAEKNAELDRIGVTRGHDGRLHKR